MCGPFNNITKRAHIYYQVDHRNKDGPLGPNSIMVVFVDPPGNNAEPYNPKPSIDRKAKDDKIKSYQPRDHTTQTLNPKPFNARKPKYTPLNPKLLNPEP